MKRYSPEESGAWCPNPDLTPNLTLGYLIYIKAENGYKWFRLDPFSCKIVILIH